MAGRLINPLVYIIFMGSYKRVRYFKLFINLYERSKKCLRLLSVALWFPYSKLLFWIYINKYESCRKRTDNKNQNTDTVEKISYTMCGHFRETRLYIYIYMYIYYTV